MSIKQTFQSTLIQTYSFHHFISHQLDPVTRKLIIDTLIEVGQSMPHRQFIFITPQDVSNVNSSPTLKILKMKPPERREVAGGHTQQTLEFSQE
jgi:hypothetical protein